MKKALKIVRTVFTWLMVIAAVSMMIFTVVSVNTFDRIDRNLFGYKAFIVLSDSMSATDFDAGDLVLSKVVDPKTLQVGDIISYQSTNTENYGKVVTHKIRALTKDADGNPGFITYGTTTDTDDENVVVYSFVLGKYQGRIPKVGKFFEFLKTTQGYIICIFIPFLVLILMQGFQSIKLFRKYKREQLAEMEAARKQQQDELAAERERLEAERAESRKMMDELMKLREQLGQSIPQQKPEEGSEDGEAPQA